MNYYFRGRVAAAGAPLSRRIPLLDFLPSTGYRTPAAPTAPPCPTTCNDLGSEEYPAGLRDVLRTAGGYGKPVYITENGTADAGDALRRRYLVQQLAVLRRAMADGVADVRGWFHWSLVGQLRVGLRLPPALRAVVLRPADAAAHRPAERRARARDLRGEPPAAGRPGPLRDAAAGGLRWASRS